MPSGDIEEVEREIAAMSRVMHAEWTSNARDAVNDLDRQIDGMTGLELAAALAAIALLVERRVDAPVSRTTREKIRRSGRRLLAAGATSARFGPVGRSTLDRGAGFAVEDLIFSSRARLRVTRMAERLRGLSEDYLRHEEARRPREDRRAQDAEDRRQATERETRRRRRAGLPAETTEQRQRRQRRQTRERHEALGRRSDGGRRARDRREWIDQANAILSDRRGLDTNILVDEWAYRQYAIGRFVAARARRLEAVVMRARAVIDGRTTAFCRWVNGKIIRMEQVRDTLEEYQTAVRHQDWERARELWPMRLPRGGNFADFRRHLVAGVGLPPYHPRCRTVAQMEVIRVPR